VNRQTEQDDRAFRIKELEEENARLRGLLGLHDRSADAHRFAWNPTLLSQASELVKVDAASSDDTKVGLLRMLFGARSDVFAVRWRTSRRDGVVGLRQSAAVGHGREAGRITWR
jgi:hypothetical protein